jgi:hypothetical protein
MNEHKHEFSLCETCLRQYRPLLYHPTCTPTPNIIPFGTVFWRDEHPFVNGRFGPLASHRNEETLQGPCYFTGADLTAARFGIWTTSLVEPRFKEFWTSAQQLIPNCNAELRTLLAQQCLECGADWHKTINVDAR